MLNDSKRCTADHLAADVWRTLRFDGYQDVEADGDEPGFQLECRTCACGRSFSKPVSPSAHVEPVSAATLLPLAAIRWALRDGEFSRDGELLIDVIHYVTSDEGRTEARYSLVEATADSRWWSLYALEGSDLDDASEDLLSSDLSKDARGAKTSYRIDALDMSFERAKFMCARTQQALETLRSAGCL